MIFNEGSLEAVNKTVGVCFDCYLGIEYGYTVHRASVRLRSVLDHSLQRLSNRGG